MTPHDIENLKSQWLSDPCWDLEDTPGYEMHRDELRAFSAACSVKWEEEQTAKHLEKAAQVGCPGNIKLGGYLCTLEERLARVEQAALQIDEPKPR